MKDKENSLREILEDILDGYDFKGGPLFKLTSKNTLHSSLIDQYPFLENGQLNPAYIDATVEMASDIYRHLAFEGDLLLIYDNVFGHNTEKESRFLDSILVKLKRKEEYSYEWIDDELELHQSIRRIYRVEGIIIEELFYQISLTDLGGDYDLASHIYIIDLASKTIFNFYDDRGLYIRAREEAILKRLWEDLPDCFFQDCHDFEIKIKKLYWIEGRQDNKEDLCLHGDLEIRLNDQVIKYSPTVSATGLRLLRSLFNDHHGSEGKQLFPCCGNTMLVNGDLDKVEIMGCDNGLNWSIIHKDGLVIIEADENLRTSCYYLQYKKVVLDFVNQVESFYKKSGEKILPVDGMDRNGYLAFWMEWEELKEKARPI